MLTIRANRETLDDRFSVLGFTVNTDAPLCEIAIASDPALFSADNRARRKRNNFYSSRAQGLLRIQRGEGVWLVPPDVLRQFVGNPRLYFGLVTYNAGSAGQPAQVQNPGAGSLYVNISGLSERGLRRLGNPAAGQGSYGVSGDGPDASLEWGGDVAATRSAPAAAPPAPAPQPAGNAPTAQGLAYSDGYDDGFWTPPARAQAVAPDDYGAVSSAQELLTRPAYAPSDWLSALTAQARMIAEAASWFAGVPDSSIFPHSAICKLIITLPNGQPGGEGTGFYIGKNLILTAGHVVSGAGSIVVVPGKKGAGTGTANEPFGRATSTAANGDLRLFPGYRPTTDTDMGLIRTSLAAPGGKFFTGLQELNQSRPEPLVVCGYSVAGRRTDAVARLVNQNIDPNKQHLHAGLVVELPSAGTMAYNIQTLAGASGAPVYWVETVNGRPVMHTAAVHIAGHDDATNKGCVINAGKLTWIAAQAAELGVRGPTAFEADEDEPQYAPASPVEQQGVVDAISRIPLDPGPGGRSIGPSALAPGDLIVSTARHAVSYGIRGGTFSSISHAMLYIGGEEVIEAVGAGVRRVALATAIDPAHTILAVAYRRKNLTADQARSVCEFAISKVGRPYNFGGIAGEGYRILNPLGAAVLDRIASRLGIARNNGESFYCSELVFEAFRHAGAPLVDGDNGSRSPQQIVEQLGRTLEYNGHLIGQNSPLGIALASAEAQAAGEGPAVELKFRAFIPSRALPAISLSGRRLFGGDDRDFSYDQGTSRAEILATVRLGVPGSGATLSLTRRGFGESTEYEYGLMQQVPGKPDWFKTVPAGTHPIDRARLPASDSNLKIELGGGGSTRENVFSFTEGTTLLHIHLAGALPLMMGAPEIDATLYVHLKVSGSNILARVHGSHDGFPAYEIYANRTRIYSYSPVTANESPTALAPPEDRTATTGWIDIGPVSGPAAVRSQAAEPEPAATPAPAEEPVAALALTEVRYAVPLVPQPDKNACWAASMAMLLGYRRRVSITPESVVSAVGGSLASSYSWDLLRRVRDHYGFVPIDQPDNTSLYISAEQWRSWLEQYGPLWVVVIGAPHAVVVSGIRERAGRVEVEILNPWDTRVRFDADPLAFNPANAGFQSWQPFDRFASDFGRMAANDYGKWRVLHLPERAATRAQAADDDMGGVMPAELDA